MTATHKRLAATWRKLSERLSDIERRGRELTKRKRSTDPPSTSYATIRIGR